jgi:plastocyanin
MGARFAGLMAASLACSSGIAAAGVIHGVLHVPPVASPVEAPANRYPGRAASLPRVAPMVHGAPTDAVISIQRIPAAADSALAARREEIPKLAQKDPSFVPRVLAIPPGASVDFPNLDPIFHNVFSVSPVKRFDLGKYPRGQSRRVTFGKAGLVQVYCDIHANMAAFILVLPNSAFARPDDRGAFALPDLPPGTYTLKVWHPDLPELSRTVAVPAQGDVALDLSY